MSFIVEGGKRVPKKGGQALFPRTSILPGLTRGQNSGRLGAEVLMLWFFQLISNAYIEVPPASPATPKPLMVAHGEFLSRWRGEGCPTVKHRFVPDELMGILSFTARGTTYETTI